VSPSIFLSADHARREKAVSWRWTARRICISGFVLFHLSGLILWTNPPCLLKDRFVVPFRYYVLPLGLWQWWAIFAPNPLRDTVCLNAEVVDAKGMRHIYEFPRIGDLPWWQKLARYRNPKFTNNMSSDEFRAQRPLTARHVVRQMGLGAESFPLTVTLFNEVKVTPPPGTAGADPMAPPRVEVIERFEFASPMEVRP
jgi:hypothetical protein